MWVIGLGCPELRVPRAGAAIAAGLLGVPVGGGRVIGHYVLLEG